LKKSLFSNLQAKILFYAFLPFVLVVVIIVVVGIQVYERIPRQVAQQRETELAKVVAAQVGRELADNTMALSRFGQALSFPEPDTTTLDELVLGGTFDLAVFDGGIAVFSSTGALLWSYPPETRGEESIPRELETIRRELQTVYSDVFRDPRTDEPAIEFAVPILTPQGSLQVVVAGVVTLAGSPMIETFASMMDFKQGRSGYAYLVDGRGKFIYHRNRSLWGTALAENLPMMRATYGLSGAILTKDVTGERVIAGFAPVEGTRWALITRERWRVIVGPVRAYSLLFLVILAAGGTASALLVFLAMGKILEPIRDLTQGARHIAAGNFDHQIIATSGDEIEELARQFSAMARSLKGLYSTLEEKVDARTREVLQQQRRLAVVEERSRVARDLHDSVSQSLYSVTLFAEAARRHLGTRNSKRAADSLDQLIGAAQQALKEMRLMVYELRPSELEKQGLIGALKQRLNTVEKRAGVDAGIDAPDSLDLPEILEQDLYGIAQEALNNALKHAHARTVTVRVRGCSDSVELEVRDDGDGFDPGSVHVKGGVGLRGMKERAEKIGAQLVVQSVPEQGTLVRVQIQTGVRGSK
jgi:signal transduction histidine kinase